MNGLKCTSCGLVNVLGAKTCQGCGINISNLGSEAEVSVPVADTFQAQNYETPAGFVDTEVGRKTFFWYRMYCGFMSLLYIFVAMMGVVLVVISSINPGMEDAEVNMITGVIYAVLGVILMLVFAAGIFLPKKSYHWIYGIVLIALGMTSCCTWPATIPLLIFWLKTETQAFLGRT